MLINLKVLDLANITQQDANKVGFSTFQISQLPLQEIPVPKSFVITSDFFFDILETNSLTLHDFTRLNTTSDKLFIPDKTKNEILSKYGELSGFSEANVNITLIYFDKESEYNERLIRLHNVKGPGNLLNSLLNLTIKFVQEFNDKAHDVVHGTKCISFLIQKTIVPEASGVSYFINNTDIKIEAVFGSYELAQKENIKSDEYVLDSTNFEIMGQNVSKQEYLFIESSNFQPPNKIKIMGSWQEKYKIDKKYIYSIANITKNINENISKNVKTWWIFEGGRIFIEWIEVIDVNSYQGTLKNNLNIPDKMDDDNNDNNQTLLTNNIGPKELDNMNFLIDGKYYAGGITKGQITLNIDKQGEGKILVLRGDEDLPSDLQVSGLIIEDSSEILAIKLNEIFNIPVITGVQLATQILKEGEIIGMDATNGKIYVQSLLKINEDKGSSKSDNFSERIEIQQYKQDLNKIQEEKLQNTVTEITKVNISNKHNLIEEQRNKKSKQINFFDNDKVIYENEKIKIERTTRMLPKVDDSKKLNSSTLDISKLLNLIEDDDTIYKISNDNSDAKDLLVVKGTNLDVGKQIQNLISYSKNITSNQALDLLEETTEQMEDLTNSKEFEFDKNEDYIHQKAQEITKPIKKQKKAYSEEYIPTVTKVHGRLIDDIAEEGKVNMDGLVFSSTQDIDTFIELLEINLQRFEDKPTFVLSPSYELLALRKYFEKIHYLRKFGYKNLHVILPDYRNKKDIINIKRLLNAIGLKRTSSFEIFANVSKTINVFRISEIDNTLVDGIFVDLFRLKMNMLGIEQYTASTRYVQGMKNLVEYISANVPTNLKVIIDITGFKNKKAILRHLQKSTKFNNISCELAVTDTLKKELKILEQKGLESRYSENNKNKKVKYIY